MDAIVEKSLEKWPNVPHCYGWLGLDARGNWRMRDEQAQQNGRLGDRLAQPALIAFINRNYTRDAKGRWYFQNGPQRVYVELQAAPFIVRIEPEMKLVLHTGAVMQQLDAVWLSDGGNLWLRREDTVARLDDRDLAYCLPLLSMDDRMVDDVALQNWMTCATSAVQLTLKWHERSIPVERLIEDDAPSAFGFVPSPQTHSETANG